MKDLVTIHLITSHHIHIFIHIKSNVTEKIVLKRSNKLNEMLRKGFIPPVCPDVLVDVREAYSSVYICVCIWSVRIR